MTRAFTAIVRVSGAGRLADFQERLRWLMVRDIDAEDYTEHHREGLLEYRFEPKKGIPFPAFASASGDFPELRIEAEWEHGGTRGRAVIENGRLVQEQTEESGAAGLDVTVDEDGRLVLALALARNDDGWLGYAVSADRQTYFRLRDRLELVAPETADEALEEVAFRFVEDWIWYDEQDAPIERARYADYGYAVRGANVRSEKLALLRRTGMRFSTLDPEAAKVRETLIERWLNRP